jgi:prevent-host-death family protein
LSEFRARAAAFVEQVQSTNEPMIITQRGRGAAVLLGIDAYETLLEEAELRRDLRLAEDQVAARCAAPREQVEHRLRAMLGR